MPRRDPAYQRQRQARKRAEGECARCMEPALPNRRRCAKHAADARAESQARMDRRRDAGTCIRCDEPAAPNRKHCQYHLDYYAEAVRRMKARRRYGKER